MAERENVAVLSFVTSSLQEWSGTSRKDEYPVTLDVLGKNVTCQVHLPQTDGGLCSLFRETPGGPAVEDGTPGCGCKPARGFNSMMSLCMVIMRMVQYLWFRCSRLDQSPLSCYRACKRRFCFGHVYGQLWAFVVIYIHYLIWSKKPWKHWLKVKVSSSLLSSFFLSFSLLS